jgi:hypothetical protein
LPAAEENKAVVSGSVALFGTYAADDDKRLVTFTIKASTFPNWDGAVQPRKIVVLNANEFINGTRAVPLGAERLHGINTCARSSSCRRPLWVDLVEEILEQIVGVYRAVGSANNVAFGSFASLSALTAPRYAFFEGLGVKFPGPTRRGASIAQARRHVGFTLNFSRIAALRRYDQTSANGEFIPRCELSKKKLPLRQQKPIWRRRRCVWRPFPFVLGAPTTELASPGHRLVSLRRGRADASLIVPVSTRIECLPVLSPFWDMISIFPRSPPFVSS